MNDSNDLLREIWSSSATGPVVVNADRVLREIERKSNEFWRLIRSRDWRELAGAALVLAMFAGFAMRARDVLVRAADLWIAASACWIAFYIRRNSRVTKSPARDQTMSDYHRALLDSYDRQIALVKDVKYWYLLPIWSGLVALSLAQWRIRRDSFTCAVVITTYTLTYAFIWWINESPGIRYLKRKRAELAALIQEFEGDR